MFSYSLKQFYRLQNIFSNLGEFLGLCWVVVSSRNFVDVKRKELACKTPGFFRNSALANGI